METIGGRRGDPPSKRAAAGAARADKYDDELQRGSRIAAFEARDFPRPRRFAARMVVSP